MAKGFDTAELKDARALLGLGVRPTSRPRFVTLTPRQGLQLSGKRCKFAFSLGLRRVFWGEVSMAEAFAVVSRNRLYLRKRKPSPRLQVPISSRRFAGLQGMKLRSR